MSRSQGGGGVSGLAGERVLLSVGHQLGSVLQALASGTSDDVGTLGQNVANYLGADGSLRGW